MIFTYILQGLTLGLSAAAAPGPFQAFLITKTLHNGWRRTLPAVLAPLISDAPIITLAVFLLSAVPPMALQLVQAAGGGYVIFLAWRAWQTFHHNAPPAPPVKTRRTLLQAVTANFLSPGPYIFWSMLAGPLLIKGWGETPARGLGFIIGFYAAMLTVLALLVFLFGAARADGARVNRFLTALSAAALFGFGVYQLWQALF